MTELYHELINPYPGHSRCFVLGYVLMPRKDTSLSTPSWPRPTRGTHPHKSTIVHKNRLQFTSDNYLPYTTSFTVFSWLPIKFLARHLYNPESDCFSFFTWNLRSLIFFQPYWECLYHDTLGTGLPLASHNMSTCSSSSFVISDGGDGSMAG